MCGSEGAGDLEEQSCCASQHGTQQVAQAAAAEALSVLQPDWHDSISTAASLNLLADFAAGSGRKHLDLQGSLGSFDVLFHAARMPRLSRQEGDSTAGWYATHKANCFVGESPIQC